MGGAKPLAVERGNGAWGEPGRGRGWGWRPGDRRGGERGRGPWRRGGAGPGRAAAPPHALPAAGAGTTELTGSTNLITHYNLEHAYNKFCGKKVKEKLSNFLPDLPGMIDLPGSHDNSSLRSLIEKPPICGSSFTPLTGTMLTGFRLHAGPVSAGPRAGGGRSGQEVPGPA